MYTVLFLKEAHVCIAKVLRSFSVNTLAFNLAFLNCIGPGTAFPVMLINSPDAADLKPVTCHAYQP